MDEMHLQEIAEWLRGVGYGVDWFTGGNHKIPDCLRLPLARAWWADSQTTEVDSSGETVNDYYLMLEEELHWT